MQRKSFSLGVWAFVTPASPSRCCLDFIFLYPSRRWCRNSNPSLFALKWKMKNEHSKTPQCDWIDFKQQRQSLGDFNLRWTSDNTEWEGLLRLNTVVDLKTPVTFVWKRDIKSQWRRLCPLFKYSVLISNIRGSDQFNSSPSAWILMKFKRMLLTTF